jgi:hypothetical protein
LTEKVRVRNLDPSELASANGKQNLGLDEGGGPKQHLGRDWFALPSPLHGDSRSDRG